MVRVARGRGGGVDVNNDDDNDDELEDYRNELYKGEGKIMMLMVKKKKKKKRIFLIKKVEEIIPGVLKAMVTKLSSHLCLYTYHFFNLKFLSVI